MVCLDVIFDTAQQKIQESMQLGTWKTLQSSLCRKGMRHALMRTGTQTRRMAEAGRDLWVHWLQKGHPEQGAQDHIQAAFGDLQGGDPTTSGQHVQGSAADSTEVLPCGQKEPPVLQFMLTASCLGRDAPVP